AEHQHDEVLELRQLGQRVNATMSDQKRERDASHSASLRELRRAPPAKPDILSYGLRPDRSACKRPRSTSENLLRRCATPAKPPTLSSLDATPSIQAAQPTTPPLERTVVLAPVPHHPGASRLLGAQSPQRDACVRPRAVHCIRTAAAPLRPRDDCGISVAPECACSACGNLADESLHLRSLVLDRVLDRRSAPGCSQAPGSVRNEL